MKYEDVLSKLSPKVLLDHYWTILDLIERWELTTFSPKFTVEGILRHLSEEQSRIDNLYYRRKCIRAQKVAEEVVTQLSELGLIERANEHFTKGEKYSEFFHFLKKNIKDSATRRVSWAVWRLYSRGVDSFTASEVLEELSYSDEDYREELELLQVRDWQLLNEVYPSSLSFKKPVLLSDLPERLFTVLEFKKESSEEEIIRKVRELEKKAVERGLRKLKLEFKEGRWQVNDIALSRVRENLRGKQSLNWAFFGNIIVRGSPYFKMLRGSSCTAYVDVPNWIVERLVGALIAVSEECGDAEEFYTRACEVVEHYNNFLKKDVEAYFKHKLDWLHFRIYKHPSMSKYGVKVSINWDSFMDFLDGFSKAEIPLWVKYEYVSLCRHISLKLALRGTLERTQEAVKEISMNDRVEIRRELNEIVSYLETVKSQLMRILWRKAWRGVLGEAPAVLLCLPEMISMVKALSSLVENGVVPSCYREMRKILENLAWAVFDDILLLRSVKRKVEVPPPPYRYISKEWYESAQQRKELTVHNLGVLKKKIKELINALEEGRGWSKKELKTLERTVFENLSYPSFLLILGEDAGTVKNEAVPVYDTSSLLAAAREDFKEVAKSLGLVPDEFADKIMMTLERITPPKVVPPYPSNDFVLSFVDKTFSTDLQKKYSEYSFFVHSYPTSWHVFPFSSVLEFKILKHELTTFLQVVSEVLGRYLNVYTT
ncbi:MAG TPA: hypothetical protein ENF26_07515 [Methanomicrobia archaeon]|nr:hypothetical protein [Methanomicrobia archaeon]HEX59976.1 hypothetical protein [Methanomicrobia archaeon]